MDATKLSLRVDRLEAKLRRQRVFGFIVTTLLVIALLGRNALPSLPGTSTVTAERIIVGANPDSYRVEIGTHSEFGLQGEGATARAFLGIAFVEPDEPGPVAALSPFGLRINRPTAPSHVNLQAWPRPSLRLGAVDAETGAELTVSRKNRSASLRLFSGKAVDRTDSVASEITLQAHDVRPLLHVNGNVPRLTLFGADGRPTFDAP